AHLRHEDDQSSLTEIGGLAAHVGTGNQKKLLPGGLEAEVVGDEALTLLAEQFLDDGMAAGDEEELAGGIEFWASVAAVGSEFGEGGQHIELCNSAGGAAQASGFGGYAAANVRKEPALDFENALVGSENFAFVIFQLGGSEALGVDECLLALIVGGDEM